MTSSIPTLDYAARPQWRGRPKTRRVILLLLVLASIYPAWRWSKPVYQHLRVLYWERQARRHTLPADTIVLCTDDEKRAASLLASKRPYVPIVDGKPDGYNTGAKGVGYAPPCVVRWLPPEPQRRSESGRWAAAGDGVLFVHDLVSPAGHRRGVAVYWEHVSLGCPRYDCECIVWEPATLLHDPKVLNRDREMNYGLGMGGAAFEYRFWAGQLDPADASHFTVRYSFFYRSDYNKLYEGTLEGWLRDDDTIKLVQKSVRDGRKQRTVEREGRHG